jgi:hypothetical protein
MVWGFQNVTFIFNYHLAKYFGKNIYALTMELDLSRNLAIALFRFAPLAMTNIYLILHKYLISRMESNATPEIVDRATWDRIAQLYMNDVKLDQNSLALIQSKKFYSSDKSPSSLQRVVNNFEAAMALDTVRNEYMLRTQISQWFIEGRDTNKLEQLNEKVYSQLFLTPSSDPWLGLLPGDTYSAIDNDGVSK